MSEERKQEFREMSGGALPDGRGSDWSNGLLRRPGMLAFVGLAGALLPILSLVAVACGVSATIDNPWQSGELRDYAALFLRYPTLLCFLPLIIYSVACLVSWLFAPASVRFVSVRLGIYSGVVMSLMFFGFVFVTTGPVTLGAAGIATIPVVILWLMLKRCWKAWCAWRIFSLRQLLALITGCAVVASLARFMQPFDLIPFLALCSLVLLGAGPTWNAVAYFLVAIHVSCRRRDPAQTLKWSLKSFACWTALLGTWMATWKHATETLLAEYAALPTRDPNCFVSSAAARGHPRLVGRTPGGTPVATPQMCRLKLLELALLAAAPKTHGLARAAYNRIGPPIAARVRHNVWLADLAYLSLKPAEWSATGIQWVLRIDESVVQRIYAPISLEHPIPPRQIIRPTPETLGNQEVSHRLKDAERDAKTV